MNMKLGAELHVRACEAVGARGRNDDVFGL